MRASPVHFTNGSPRTCRNSVPNIISPDGGRGVTRRRCDLVCLILSLILWIYWCDVCLSFFSPLCFSCIRNLNRTQRAFYLRFKVLLHAVSHSFAVSAVPPLTADLTLHLLYFIFLCPHLTSNTTRCASAPSLSFLPFFTGVPYNRWGLAPTGTLSVCLPPGQQADECVRACVGVCVCFDVFSDPATLSTCDILAPQSIPRGHVHTERYGHTHHLHLPVTFWVLPVEVLISFFCALFGITKPGYIYFLLALFFRGQRLLLQPPFKKTLCLFFNLCFKLLPFGRPVLDEMLRLLHRLFSYNLTFSISVCLLPLPPCPLVGLALNFFRWVKPLKSNETKKPRPISLCWKPKWPSLSVSQPLQLPCGEPLLLVLSVISSLQRSQ